MSGKPLRLKRHETFSIKEGWLEKGLNKINEDPECLKQNNGPLKLGLGSNMCKSLRYWLTASELVNFKIQKNPEITEVGKLILEYDPYFENIFTWWIVHCNLALNFDDCPVINAFFNMDYSKIEKESLFRLLKNKFEEEYEIGSDSSLESDITVLLKTYFSDDKSNPEDNSNCPLGKLNLVKYHGKKIFSKNAPSISSLDYRVVYYCLVKMIKREYENETKEFNLEDIYKKSNNPLKILNLTKSGFLHYLEELKSHGYIKIVKTAGLNTVYLEKDIPIAELFKSYYKED